MLNLAVILYTTREVHLLQVTSAITQHLHGIQIHQVYHSPFQSTRPQRFWLGKQVPD